MKILLPVLKPALSFRLFLPFLTFTMLFSGQLSSSLYAQNVLAFENVNRFKRIIYVPGDMIRFQLDDSKTVFSGRIESVNDSQVVILKSLVMENAGDVSTRVFREYVSIDRIRFVYKRSTGSYGEFFYGMLSGGLISGGLMYVVLLPIDAFFGQSRLSPTNMSIGASMLAAGGLMALLRKKKQRVGDKWVLKPMTPITPEYPPIKE
jgi:hypothetical protein